MSKQINAVLDAVNEGYRNLLEIAEVTGLSVAAVSSYLTELADQGLIRRGRLRKFKYATRGPHHHEYLPLSEAAA